MAANTIVELTSLDFDDLRTSLKTYLKTQNRFQDMDFEGSNIAVLLDVMAYNTYLNTFYTNMVASEMFLDTSQRRDSIISHAKSLNYLPRSFRSSKAYVNLTITPATPANTVVVNKGTSFTSKVGANTFTFTIPETRILTSTNNTFTATDVAIYEGPYITDTFVMDYTIASQQFILSSEVVDTDSVAVQVIEDSGTTTLDYVVGTSLFGLTSSSQTCFLQASKQEKYELLFGDGTIGRRPQNGSIINVSYRVSSGELGNGATTFSVDTSIDGHSNVVVTTIQPSSGGIISESDESIRFNAPRYFQTQERAVTVTDYKSLLFARFPEITSVNVYGGENATPPRYGKVLVSVDVVDADGVPEYKKNEYLQYVRERCSLSIDPVFVDPSFMYIGVVCNVRYNANATVLTQQDIEASVVASILKYSNDSLNDFSVTLRSSNISRQIDSADRSILSNDLTVKPYIMIVPAIGVSYRNEIAFGNALRQRSLTSIPSLVTEQAIFSTTFTYQGTDGASLLDNGQGVLQIVLVSPTSILTLKDNAGTVNYQTGRVNITDLLVSSFAGNGIKIYVNPASGDVVATNNLIMRIDAADIDVTVTPERI